MMKKVTIIIIAVLLIMPFVFLPVEAAITVSHVKDGAGLLSDAEKAHIETLCTDMKAETGVDCFIITTKDRDYPENRFLDFTDLNSSVLVLTVTGIGSDNRHYDIYKYGEAADRIYLSEVDKIVEKMLGDMKNENFAAAFETFLGQSRIAFKSEGNKMPKTTGEVFTVIAIALAVSAVIGGITCGVVIGRYKMKIKPTNYPLDRYAKLKLTVKSDMLVNKFVRTRRIESSSGGKSGGSSGNGGSGHAGGSSF